ncbi:MAG TPA: hypothetical protein VKF81_10320, partial [Blastocatellia bacterium]|nr:hypothetical protein [Blastocatellia bacterium]
EGMSYYVRDVTTDGGRLNQQFCFAYVEGKLIVTTTEGLMIRAIGNIKNSGADSLLADVIALAGSASGFAAHDVTMWLDQGRLNRNRYFDNYWIHHNASGELAAIENGLIDLRITREGMTEQRWFKMGAGGQGLGAGAISGEQLGALMKFAPADAQLVKAQRAASTDQLSSAVEKALFGKLPGQNTSPPEMPADRAHKAGSEDETNRAERYSRLDSRFDIDVDDEQAPRSGLGAGSRKLEKGTVVEPQSNSFARNIGVLLASVSSGDYCELVRSKSESEKPFIKFERAVIVHLKSEASLNREVLERAIIDELRTRFVVSGTEPRLTLQDEGPVRSVAESLLKQGAAYGVSGNYLVLASSKGFASDIFQAARAQQAPVTLPEPANLYALIRVASAKPVFDTLMSKLDGREQKTKPKRRKEDNEDDEERDVKFFSENLSSLISASAIREARLSRRSERGVISERIVYAW